MTPITAGIGGHRLPHKPGGSKSDLQGQEANLIFQPFSGKFWYFSTLIHHNFKFGASVPAISERGTKDLKHGIFCVFKISRF